MSRGQKKEDVSCSTCDAVCCRLTVVLMPEDDVPRRFIAQQKGLDVMAHGKDGWCAALDHEHMCCSIYDHRPTVCRRFVMGGAYCRSEREAYRPHADRAIPIVVI